MRTASRASSVDHYSSVAARPHDGSFGFVKASFGLSSARWNPHDRFGIVPRPRAMRAVTLPSLSNTRAVLQARYGPALFFRRLIGDLGPWAAASLRYKVP